MQLTPILAEPTPDGPPRAPKHSARSLRARAFARHHRLVIALVLVTLYVAVRMVFLTADPPTRLPNGARVYELFSDPAAKSFEARTRALFGSWDATPADNYNFWRAQAPVWVYPLSWFYRVFGVGYAQLRIYSTLCSATGLLAMLMLAGTKLRGLPYLASGFFLTFNYYYVVYGRSGLVETLLNTFVILTVLFLYLSRRHLGFIFAVQWALVAGFLTKQSGLYLAPLALVAGIFIYVKHLRRGVPRWLAIAPIAHAIALLAMLVVYVLEEDYWRTVAWNYGHVLLNKDGVDEVELHRFSPLDVLDRLRVVATWTKGYILLFPIAGTLATIQLGRILWRGFKKKRWSAWEAIIAAWLVSGFGVLLLTPFLWVHYRLILFPPVMLLAGAWLQALPQTRWARKSPRRAPRLTIALMAAAFVTHGIWFAMWAVERRYDIREISAGIETALKYRRNPVVVGMWAPPVLFDTRLKYFYVRAIFNADPEVLEDLNVTNLFQMEENDVAAWRLRKLFPKQMKKRFVLGEFELRGTTMTLYQFRGPLRVDGEVD